MRKLDEMTEPELAELMRGLADAVVMVAESVFEVEKPMFALILMNDPAVGQYICNCKRREMIDVLRSTADRIERNEDVTR